MRDRVLFSTLVLIGMAGCDKTAATTTCTVDQDCPELSYCDAPLPSISDLRCVVAQPGVCRPQDDSTYDAPCVDHRDCKLRGFCAAPAVHHLRVLHRPGIRSRARGLRPRLHVRQAHLHVRRVLLSVAVRALRRVVGRRPAHRRPVTSRWRRAPRPETAAIADVCSRRPPHGRDTIEPCVLRDEPWSLVQLCSRSGLAAPAAGCRFLRTAAAVR